MSSLTSIEKLKLEKFFGMSSGYVLDFSNRTIQEFVAENASRDIYDSKYAYGSGSKANRIRAFWDKEPGPVVGKLLTDMLEYWKAGKLMRYEKINPPEQALHDECLRIAERIKRDSVVENIDALQPNVDDKNFQLLAKSIRESIEKNEPESAIDRLHTFVVRYIRELCDKHSISYVKDTPLHSLFGGYIKFLQENKLIESEMTERILKSSISVLEAFNSVRNNRSFAHDNAILNYSESVLIFNDIANVIRFIESVEPKESPEKETDLKEEISLEDIPF